MKFLNDRKQLGNVDDWLSAKAEERRNKLAAQISDWNTAEKEISELQEYAGLPVDPVSSAPRSALHSLEDLISFSGTPNLDILRSGVSYSESTPNERSPMSGFGPGLSEFRRLTQQAKFNADLLLQNCEESLARVELDVDSFMPEFLGQSEHGKQREHELTNHRDSGTKQTEKNDFKM